MGGAETGRRTAELTPHLRRGRAGVTNGRPARLVLAVSLGAIVSLTACGKRGDPLPPLRQSPAAAERLQVSQRGAAILLEWQAPSRNADGSTDVRLDHTEILRRVIEPSAAGEVSAAAGEETTTPSLVPGESPPPIPGQETEPDTEPQAPESAETPAMQAPPFSSNATVIATIESKKEGEGLIYQDPWDPSFQGKRLEYAVRHVNRKGRRSDISPVAPIDPLPPLEPPREVAAESTALGVELTWTSDVAPSEVGETRSFGFHVFRKGEEEPDFPRSPLHEVPLAEPRFVDPGAGYGKTWCYVVRSAVVPSAASLAEGTGGGLIESLDSIPVCTTPVDTFPPPVPGDLVAVASSDGVLLSWNEVEVRDLVGYRVYRGTRPDGPFELLSHESVNTASFVDRTAKAGSLYFYVVTSLDRVEPPNESSPSGPASVRVQQP